jgi:hypothetical protein
LEEEKPFYDRLKRVARDHLERAGEMLKQRSVRVRGEIRLGNRAEEITGFAKEVGADLMVLTSPAFDPNNPRTGLSSLSWKIGILSPCPVLLVKWVKKVSAPAADDLAGEVELFPGGEIGVVGCKGDRVVNQPGGIAKTHECEHGLAQPLALARQWHDYEPLSVKQPLSNVVGAGNAAVREAAVKQLGQRRLRHYPWSSR